MKKMHLTAVLAALLMGAAIVASSPARATVASPFDEHWLKASAEGSLYEVAVGNLALRKGSGGVCSVAQVLVTDHTKSLKDTLALAKRLGVKLPTRPNPLQRQLVVEYSRATGFTFQRMFAAIGVACFAPTSTRQIEAAKKAEDARVRAFARKEVPTLKMHLGAFQALLKKTLANPGSATGTSAGTAAAAATTPTATTPTATTPTATTTTPAAATGAPGCS